jgi:hypothetical protein
MGSGENLEKVEAFFAELASEGRTIVRGMDSSSLALYVSHQALGRDVMLHSNILI